MYLVALQECNAKLKEKHDKIEALEMRSASEISNQKKEERILSTTIRAWVDADAAEAEEWAIGLFSMSVSKPLWLLISSKCNLVMHVAQGLGKACVSSSYDYTGSLNLFISLGLISDTKMCWG
jgi:hypothetical protein